MHVLVKNIVWYKIKYVKSRGLFDEPATVREVGKKQDPLERLSSHMF